MHICAWDFTAYITGIKMGYGVSLIAHNIVDLEKLFEVIESNF